MFTIKTTSNICRALIPKQLTQTHIYNFSEEEKENKEFPEWLEAILHKLEESNKKSKNLNSIEKEELIKGLIRCNYVNKYTLHSILQNQQLLSNKFNNSQEFLKIKRLENSHYNELEDLMINKRVRPSLLTPILGVSAVGMGILSSLLPSSTFYMGLKVFEETIQNEHDEQLRTLNELKVEEKEFRGLICKHRDAGYDLLEEIFGEEETKSISDDTNINTHIFNDKSGEDYIENSIKYISEYSAKLLIRLSKSL